MKTSMHKVAMLGAAAGGVISAMSSAANAQSNDGLDVIVVTSERREQDLQKTPAAVSAFTAEFIESSRIQSFEDVSLKVPSLTFSSANKTVTFPALRGAGTSFVSPGVDQSIGIFIDEVYQGSFSDFDPDLFGLERIEVLRGPQGTLYGRNVTGGALNFITAKPGDELEAAARISFGNFDYLEATGRIAGPIVEDRLFGSISFSSKKRDGISNNRLTGEDLDDLDKDSIRTRLVYDVSSNVELDLSADYSRDTSSVEARDYIGPTPTIPALAAVNFMPDSDPETVDITPENAGDIDREIFGFSLRATIDVGFAELVSLSAYRENHSFTPFSSILGTPVPTVGFQFDTDADQFTQEIRLTSKSDGPLDWVAGVFFLDSQNRLIDSQDANLLPGSFIHEDFVANGIGSAGVPIRLLSRATTDVSTTSYAAFAQFTYALTDQLNVTAGARYTYEEKDAFLAVEELPGSDPDPIFAGAGAFAVTGSADFDAFTPRVTLDYSISDNALIYATFSQGFKSGGFNINTDDPVASQNPFEPERATNYEAGIKTRLFDNKLQVNIAGFHVDYKDLQIQTTSPDLMTLIDNAGAAQVTGIEVETQAALSDSFDVWLSYSFLDAELDEFIFPGFGPVVSRLPFAPKHALAAGFAYTHDMGPSGSLRFQANYQYKGEFLLETRPDFAESQFLSGFDNQIDASVAYSPKDSRWEFSLWGRNLADERYIIFGQDQDAFTYTLDELMAGATASQPRYNQPRTWGGSIIWRY